MDERTLRFGLAVVCAEAMILTTEGLSAVFGAVVESRKIFARLFSRLGRS